MTKFQIGDYVYVTDEPDYVFRIAHNRVLDHDGSAWYAAEIDRVFQNYYILEQNLTLLKSAHEVSRSHALINEV